MLRTEKVKYPCRHTEGVLWMAAWPLPAEIKMRREALEKGCPAHLLSCLIGLLCRDVIDKAKLFFGKGRVLQ